MPYRSKRGGFERARRLGYVPIVQNPAIQGRLQNWRRYNNATAPDVADELLMRADDLPRRGQELKWVLSFDGSAQEVAEREEFPSTRVGYLQVAGVLVDLERLRAEAAQSLVDPANIELAVDESLYSAVLPGSNVCRNDAETVQESWRIEIFGYRTLFRCWLPKPGRAFLSWRRWEVIAQQFFQAPDMIGQASHHRGRALLPLAPIQFGSSQPKPQSSVRSYKVEDGIFQIELALQVEFLLGVRERFPDESAIALT